MHESRRHKNHLPPKKYGDGNLEKVWKNRSNRCFIILITDAFSELNLISLRRSRAENGERSCDLLLRQRRRLYLLLVVANGNG